MSSQEAKRLFGTDGMRGEAGSFPLDGPTIRTVGLSLAAHLREKVGRTPVVVIGRDTRESGPWLEQVLSDGLSAGGSEYKSAGVITTPGVAYLTRVLNADAGVVISASHNPYQDNGIKIFAPSGKKMDDETERLIEADIVSGSRAGLAEQLIGGTPARESDSRKLGSSYLDFLINQIGEGLRLNGLTLVVDCANGAASPFAANLFEQLGARVVSINNTPNGQNINRDCGSLHIETLKKRVLQEAADLGIAFDGDADRALFVDSQGTLVDGDATLWVLANYLKSRGKLAKGIVVATVMSNIGLELALRSRELRMIRTDVGDKHVLDELLSSGAELGGEQSGHIIFPQVSLAGDGMITSLFVLRAIVEERKALGELTTGFQRYPQILVNVRVRNKKPFPEVPEVQELAREIESQLNSEGRLLLRYSGTEPLARIMIEGSSQGEIEQYARSLAKTIEQKLG